MEILTRSKLCHFVSPYVVRAKLFCLNSFIPVTGLECSYGKIFFPVTEILLAKTEISVTGPVRASHMNTYFYKEKSNEVRSREPSQPGWPGSYEEALRSWFLPLLLDTLTIVALTFPSLLRINCSTLRSFHWRRIILENDSVTDSYSSTVTTDRPCCGVLS